MSKKLVSILIILSIALMGLTGCSNTTPSVTDNDISSTTPESKELHKVVVSEFRGLNWMSAYVADLLGYFEEEGLDVEFAIYKDGPIAFQGMHAGDSDFCLLSAEPVLRAYDEGMESYLILTNTKNRTYAFATRPDIKEMKDLKGKTVFAGMPGSAPYSFVLSLLKEAGLSENDVSFINLEYGAAIVALAQGQADGIFFDIYNKKTLVDAVPGVNILVDATIPETHKKLYGTELCETTIVTCTKKFADENPEIVQKFTNASVRALKWINEHNEEEIAQLVLPMFEGMTKEELVQNLETIKTSFSSTGEIHPEGYQTVENFCYEQGLIKKRIGYDSIVASQFVKKALETIK
ncbi:ABC transporter substrate-binding protein [Lutispora thermophila]|uniref:NitT/TauT family transport system substrate-binding protein n=1 Tax=Lutispora thermophila DSM 19022 TaxID=1122184 RepID=A0A1M6D2H7_9FIRM|nr:ABC transporter substrate-binding protein [Lutispora thermophila]SHI67495.1 NitT/TauT family transport system substrate-binding protein [Lutispora thermophila DSM 19022]